MTSSDRDPHQDADRRLEQALTWAPGAINRILDGGDHQALSTTSGPPSTRPGRVHLPPSPDAGKTGCLEVLTKTMNRYHAWIDVSDLRRLFAVQLISWLTWGTLMGLAWTLIAGWSWITLIAVGAIPLA